MKILTSLALFIIVISCNQDNIEPDKGNCGIEATVRDLTGLDGCGFVFELNNGARLEPIRLFFAELHHSQRKLPKILFSIFNSLMERKFGLGMRK